MATVDTANVQGWTKGATQWKKTVGKIQNLFNLQNRSSVVSNQIKSSFGRKFKTPVVTRYDTFTIHMDFLQIFYICKMEQLL